jgi:hypothetical protein
MFATQEQFEILPEKPFIYWVPPSTTVKLSSHPKFEPIAGNVRQGLVTGDNPRFVRAVWEVSPKELETEGRWNEEGGSPKTWVPLVMTGASQPWFSPIGVVLKWKNKGAELRQFVRKYGSPSRLIKSEDFYFRPGFSWTRRAVRFIPYRIPSGCIFTASRYMAFPRPELQFAALGVTASNVATAFLRFYGERFAHPNFLVETVKAVPWPSLTKDLETKLEDLVRREVGLRRRAYQKHEPFHEFTVPAILLSDDSEGALAFDMQSLLGVELETAIGNAYGLSASDVSLLERDVREAIQARRAPPSKEAAENGEEGEAEEEEEGEDNRDFVIAVDPVARQEDLISYAMGCAFGRWDVRIGSDPSLAPKLPGPFDPLPVCPPGMLVGQDGLPAKPGGIVSERWLLARPDARSLPAKGAVDESVIRDEQYPLPSIPWDGILVDDEGHHSDVVARIGDVLRVLFGDDAEEVERHACEILGVKNLRAYFRNPRGFFDDHIGRYSKSRRKAPIYWLLQSSKRSYGVWIYYHRLTKDKLFHLLQSYVEPKIEHEEGRRHELRRLYEAAKTSKNVGEERKLAKEVDAQELLVGELSEFKAKIEATAYGRVPGAESGCAGWDPNLNDGVILNAAPLHAIMPWKDAAKTWGELTAGRCDWSHIALCFWPDRVRTKCHDDLSIAIAHDLGGT